MVLAAAHPVHFRLDELQRALGRALPSASLSTEGGPPLELSAAVDPPVIARADVVEDDALHARSVIGDPEPHFTAFLDGTQRSDLMAHAEDGAPIVLGVTAAVVRQWTLGRAATWAHVVRQRLYAPKRAMRATEWDVLEALGPAAIDTSADDPTLADAHPLAHRDAALKQIHRDREQLEQQLAQKWCAERPEALYVDGGLRGSVILARAAQTVGVIKSHRTLYGDGVARRVIFALDERERSSVFVVASPSRVPVASWYLRLRPRAGRDPLWGLVRVEVRHEPDMPRPAITARADDLSRRILAERSPTAHPDGRWDTMAYGIRDCEVFLKAIQ